MFGPMQFSVAILIMLVVMVTTSRSGYSTTIGKQEKELEKGPITKDQNLKVQLYSSASFNIKYQLTSYSFMIHPVINGQTAPHFHHPGVH
jgi:hypothetical protein